MMSFNKRKMPSDVFDKDDSFKLRRSSLMVNLSYNENLTDSGNGSLWRTEIENVEGRTATDKRKLSRSKNKYEKSHRAHFDDEDLQAVSSISKGALNNEKISFEAKKGIQLKRLTIDLEDISTKEKALETNCKRLKNAILNKMKEIFDKQDELSIRTATILNNEQNPFADPNTANKSIVLLDKTSNRYSKDKTRYNQCTDIMSNQQRENQHSNIVATPTNSEKRRNFERVVDKSKLTQRRLFTDKNKQIEEQTKCKIIDNVILKRNVPLISLKHACENNSPILSSSNSRLGLLRTRSKLRSQDQPENHNNTYSTIRSFDIGAPIVCSTFIEDNVMNEKKNKSYCDEVNVDEDVSRATCTTNKVISMDITEVRGGIRTSEEYMSLQSRDSNMHNCIENRTEGKRAMQKSEDVSSSVNQLTKGSNIAHKCMDTTVQTSIQEMTIATKTCDVPQTHEGGNESKSQSNRRRTLSLSDSSNTSRSSLNVNTSLDAVNKVRKVRKSSDSATIDNEGTTASDNQRESVNANRTSLQMNTSVDSVYKWKRNDYVREQSSVQDKVDEYLSGNHSSKDNQFLPVVENKEANVNILENISLIERLRIISMQDQVLNETKISEIKDKEKVTYIDFNNIQCQNNEHTNKSGDSYVEATPIGRSTLIRSHMRHKTQNSDDNAIYNTNLNSIDNKEDNDETKSDVLLFKTLDAVSNGTSKAISDTVILENTPSSNPFIQNQPIVVEDTPEDIISLETGAKDTIALQNTECIPVKRGKRKLLPLNETSQLCSITPVDENDCIPKKSTSVKKNKILKKKHSKKKSINSKNNINNIKYNISDKLTSSNDHIVFENKKKKDKIPRKPRKVVSKKIVIKKFADENVLKILEKKRNKGDQSVEQRNSIDDFAKNRTVSTERNKYKSQKIVIVTTGLSKGDKSLVTSIVKSLGMAEMELNVSKRTTHVVSTGVRTVNLLRGIIRGCWLVPFEWVLKSLENNAWLNPEAFEMKHFSKAVQENRQDRQLFGLSYIPELFTTCGLICIEHKTTVPCDILKELIKTAGGHITENIKLAKIIIGTNGLKETWVLDSITTGELQLTKLYQRK